MVYDTVHKLAAELKNSAEFLEYKAAKEKAFVDETNAGLLKQFQKATLEMQAHMAAQTTPPDELKERHEKILSVLQLNPDCIAYLMAEYKLNATMGDIFRILSDSVDLHLDFLRD